MVSLLAENKCSRISESPTAALQHTDHKCKRTQQHCNVALRQDET